CGGGRYRKVRSRRWIAFVSDRVCLDCERRYAPPTPRWAGLVFLVAGAILLLVGLAGIVGSVLGLLRGDVDPVSAGLSGGIILVGALAIWHGARAVLFAGSV